MVGPAMTSEHVLDEAALQQWRRQLHQARRFAEAEQFLDAVRRAERTVVALEVALEGAAADHPLREEAQMLLAMGRRLLEEVRQGYAAWRGRLVQMHEKRLDPGYQAEVVERPLPEGLPG